MLCARPFRRGVMEFGCGQCMPCRLNRKRLWTIRLMLEATQHEFSYFVTLTYRPEVCPNELRKRDLQLWLKRLRKNTGEKIRYFGVGEYGEVTGRPHFHAALFGLRESMEVERAWGQGFVHVGSLTHESAGYVVSYVAKGMTKVDDVRLKGRAPEFATMSKHPGLGAGAMPVIAAEVNKKYGVDYIARNGDIPTWVRWNKKKYPLGRYLCGQVRMAAGYGSGVPTVLLDRLGREKVEELSVPGAFEVREEKRSAGNVAAVGRNRISHSKRSL